MGMLAPDLPTGRQDAAQVLARIAREGEQLLGELVDRYHPALLRLARAIVPTEKGAGELAHGTWMALLDAGPACGGRTFRCWLFGLLVDRARRAAAKGGAPVDLSGAPAGPALPARRFRADGERHAGHWSAPPAAWPEGEAAGRREELVAAALARLPAGPRLVFTLRDVERCEAAEVCDILGVGEPVERGLLHRARSAVRAALEESLAGAPK